MKKILIITTLFVLGLMLSCKKDEVAIVAKTKKESLIAKPWVINEVIASNASVSNVSVYKKGGADLLNVGFPKVVLKFNSDGTMSGFDNSGKAIPSTAKWILSSDETKLNISNTGVLALDGDSPIVVLNDTNLELKGKVTYQGSLFDGNLKMIPQ